MYQVPEEWQKLLQKDLKLSKNWGTEGMNAEMARYNAMTPAQKAAENNRRRANNEARSALANAPAAARRSFPSPAAAPVANTRRAFPAAVAAPKAPKGKVMRECTASNAMHNVTMKNGSKAPCKFVHKNENAFGMLRPEQRKAEGGKTRRSSKGRSSRRSRSSKGRSSRTKSSRRRGGSVPNSPKPLSNVNTYTSWPGGVDPTAPLYNMKTML